MPQLFLASLLTPVFKGKGKDPNLATSYRPVANTSWLARLLERIVLLRAERFVDPQLPASQRGSRRGGSAVVAARMISEFIRAQLTQMDRYVHIGGRSRQRRQVHGLSVDATDAFPSIALRAVRVGLQRCSLPPYLVEWWMTFLGEEVVGVDGSPRHIQTIVNGVRSRKLPTYAGVPQGTLSGPTIWLVATMPLIHQLEQLAAQACADGKPTLSVSFVDDVYFLVASADPRLVTAPILQRAADIFARFYPPNNVTISTKSELVAFGGTTRARTAAAVAAAAAAAAAPPPVAVPAAPAAAPPPAPPSPPTSSVASEAGESGDDSSGGTPRPAAANSQCPVTLLNQHLPTVLPSTATPWRALGAFFNRNGEGTLLAAARMLRDLADRLGSTVTITTPSERRQLYLSYGISKLNPAMFTPHARGIVECELAHVECCAVISGAVRRTTPAALVVREAGFRSLSMEMERLRLRAEEAALTLCDRDFVAPDLLDATGQAHPRSAQRRTLPYDPLVAAELCSNVAFFGLPESHPPTVRADDPVPARFRDSLNRMCEAALWLGRQYYEGWTDGTVKAVEAAGTGSQDAGPVDGDDAPPDVRSAGGWCFFNGPSDLNVLTMLADDIDAGHYDDAIVSADGEKPTLDLPHLAGNPDDRGGKATGAVGPCSFTAESGAMEDLLGALVLRVRVGTLVAQGRGLLLGVDSQSLMQALSCGIGAVGALLCRHERAMVIWGYLLELASAGMRIALVFIFSHCGIPRNGLADQWTAELFVGVAMTPAVPVWRVDAARHRWKQETDLDDEAAHAVRRGTDAPLYRPTRIGARESNAVVRIRTQARAGIIPALGILDHAAPPPCPFCGAPAMMARGGTGVHHLLLTCTAPVVTAARTRTRVPPAEWTAAVVWDKPREAVAFFSELIDEKAAIDAAGPPAQAPPTPPLVPVAPPPQHAPVLPTPPPPAPLAAPPADAPPPSPRARFIQARREEFRAACDELAAAENPGDELPQRCRARIPSTRPGPTDWRLATKRVCGTLRCQVHRRAPVHRSRSPGPVAPPLADEEAVVAVAPPPQAAAAPAPPPPPVAGPPLAAPGAGVVAQTATQMERRNREAERSLLGAGYPLPPRELYGQRCPALLENGNQCAVALPCGRSSHQWFLAPRRRCFYHVGDNLPCGTLMPCRRDHKEWMQANHPLSGEDPFASYGGATVNQPAPEAAPRAYNYDIARRAAVNATRAAASPWYFPPGGGACAVEGCSGSLPCLRPGHHWTLEQPPRRCFGECKLFWGRGAEGGGPVVRCGATMPCSAKGHVAWMEVNYPRARKDAPPVLPQFPQWTHPAATRPELRQHTVGAARLLATQCQADVLAVRFAADDGPAATEDLLFFTHTVLDRLPVRGATSPWADWHRALYAAGQHNDDNLPGQLFHLVRAARRYLRPPPAAPAAPATVGGAMDPRRYCDARGNPHPIHVSRLIDAGFHDIAPLLVDRSWAATVPVIPVGWGGMPAVDAQVQQEILDELQAGIADGSVPEQVRKWITAVVAAYDQPGPPPSAYWTPMIVRVRDLRLLRDQQTGGAGGSADDARPGPAPVDESDDDAPPAPARPPGSPSPEPAPPAAPTERATTSTPPPPLLTPSPPPPRAPVPRMLPAAPWPDPPRERFPHPSFRELARRRSHRLGGRSRWPRGPRPRRRHRHPRPTTCRRRRSAGGNARAPSRAGCLDRDRASAPDWSHTCHRSQVLDAARRPSH